MAYIKVKLFGKEIGRLVWESSERRSYFMYNPQYKGMIPDIAPLLSPAGSRNEMLPVYGDDRPIYQGLPPFIADSLPDSWGNTLFDKWVKDNKIPRNKITPLYKLMFIGTRGMGALEYEPSAADLAKNRAIDIKSLYGLSLKILEERDSLAVNPGEELTLQSLLAVGTSAGGRQMKAIIAINKETGEIRSGQTDGLEEFEYYILKFGAESIPIAEIEAAYGKMAASAGIDMEESGLFPVEGMNHFLTKRFDRKNGKKIYVQTLAAINPEARSYEDLIATCRELHVEESEVEQMFARMVFNVMANNTDDHNKNFSFLLKENGSWGIAPAYDVTFIFNVNGTGPNQDRRLGIGGKTSGITKEDLLDFARQNEIGGANEIIDSVAAALGRFDEYACQTGISRPWRAIIQKTLNSTLASFGYLPGSDNNDQEICDKYGRMISEIGVSVNSKGYYDVKAVIDGSRRRRFIRPAMKLYAGMSELDIFNLTNEQKTELAEKLFPPE